MAAAIPASLVLDRLVSASSAEDAQSSLEKILEALQSNKKRSTSDDDGTQMAPELIWSDPEILTALRHVLHTGQHKHHDMVVPVEEGASLVCKIYTEMLEQEPKSPLLDKDESLIEVLIDVISSDEKEVPSSGVPMYTRVLAVQLLTQLCKKSSKKAQAQLLQAPNGLHRLGDLMHVNQEEIIRNEALLLAQVIAEWPSCAKIWMFSEVADQVMFLALEEGGLTSGNLLVQDCLDLLYCLLKHDPNNLADLVFQSPTLASNLPRLLDLRQGTEFVNPRKKKAPVAKKDDDLDDILKSASATEPESQKDEVVIPRLTAGEEQVIQKMLNIMALLLESDALKESVWKGQLGLCSLLWELALVSPPPPQVPFVCAVPSPQLQQKALETTALYFHDPVTMERHAGLDRLLYLVCTGGLGATLKEKMGISQAALHVIRKTVSEESASQMLMHTLAPPMTTDEYDQNGEPRNAPPPPTVVHKLLNTVAENLTVTQGIDPERRKLFLAGALGGLTIFLTDQTSREVLLRITTNSTGGEDDNRDNPDPSRTTTTSLIDSILHALGTMEETQNPEDVFLSMTLLRFLCHWTVHAPLVAQTILSSNQSSIVLSALLGIKTKSQSNKRGVSTLGKLLLGLAMEYMGDDEEKCGGWTRTSILELISKKSGGVSKYTSSLEQFKSVQDFGDSMPWSVCELEFKVWSQWYSECVLLVRKRVVAELTGSGEGVEDETDDEGIQAGEPAATEVSAGGSSSARSLQKLVYQQSKEIDELQQSLVKANAKIDSQQNELSRYKRRVESAPSQLDNMLNEYSTKTSELETKVATLEEEKRALEAKHVSELQGRDEQIAALQRELEESRAREKESRDETESLREEISSLSQAYTNLEQEYRQQQEQQQERQASAEASAPTTAPSEQRPGEQEQEGPQQQQQSQTPNVNGVRSNELSALRAENERLRSDAQAADQWMAMAVDKMKVFGEQNAMLQRELTTLRESQSKSMNEQQQQLQQQYQALFEENQSRVQQQQQLQSQLDSASNRNQQLQSQLESSTQNIQQLHSELESANQGNQNLQQVLDEEREQNQDLQRHLASSREELQSALATLEENKSMTSRAQAEHESKVEEMERDLKNASAEVNRLREELARQQEQQQQSLQNRNSDEQLNAQALAQATAQHDAFKQELEDLKQTSSQIEAERQSLIAEVEALKSSIGSLQAEVEATRAELERTRRHEQEEIYKREARIRELEARINNKSGGQGGYTEDDIKIRDKEISELQAANDAAQDWMAKAVDHHQVLSEQHARVTADNATLSSQLRELKTKVAQNEAVVARANVLEQEASMQTGKLREAQASLAACEEELERLRAEVEKLCKEKDSLREELQKLSSQQEASEEDSKKVLELVLQLQSIKEANIELERTQKDDKSLIDRLKAEYNALLSETASTTRASASLPPGQANEATNALDFFSTGGPSASAGAQASTVPADTASQFFSSGGPALSTGASGSDTAIDFFSTGGPAASTGTSSSSANVEAASQLFSKGGAATSVASGDLAQQNAEKTQRIKQLESQLKETTAELDEARKNIAEDGNVVRAWEGKSPVQSVA
jgi:chromosome segregation ATPase